MIDKKINITDIQRFAIHDGPGIRTTVFLKGCPLYCPWCSNPETQKKNTEIFFDKKKCTKCMKCVNDCKSQALSFEGEALRFNSNKCTNCNLCVSECMENAITFTGKQMTVEEIIKEVAKDDDYYEKDNGGVTLSGGEIFTQVEGLMDLVKELKNKNYHICIETTAQTSEENVKKILPYIDLFFVDMKHSSKDILKEVTGGNLDLIKKNIEIIAKYNNENIILRIPVIPNFNDDEKVIEEIISFASSLNIKKVELLPFHNYGKNKYTKLDLKYQFSSQFSLMKSDLLKYIKLGEKYNIEVK